MMRQALGKPRYGPPQSGFWLANSALQPIIVSSVPHPLFSIYRQSNSIRLCLSMGASLFENSYGVTIVAVFQPVAA